eukprot:850513_1
MMMNRIVETGIGNGINNYDCFNSRTDWWYEKRKPLKVFTKYHRDKYGDASLILTGLEVVKLGGLATSHSMCTHDASAMLMCAGCYKHGFYHGHKFRVKDLYAAQYRESKGLICNSAQ